MSDHDRKPEVNRTIVVVARVHFDMTVLGEARHSVEVDLSFSSDGRGGWIVRKAAPEWCGGANITFEGRGKSMSLAALDWINSLCGSPAYIPLYQRQRAPEASSESPRLVPRMDFDALD